MKFRLGWLAALFAVLLVATACEETTTPDTPLTAPNAPTGLMANSANATTITLKWTAPAGGQTPTGYIINYSEDGSSTTTSLSISGSSNTTGVVTNLTEGKMYNFNVVAVNDTAKSAPSVSVKWAPAKRLTGSFKLYSSTNTTNGSGLSLREARVVKIAESSKWEFCFDDKDTRPLVGSPGVSGYNAPDFPIVSMDTVHYVRANSLDDVFDTQALDNSTAGFKENLVNLATLPNPDTGVVLIMRSRVDASTVNFAKILVKRNAAGTGFVNGAGSDSYVEVEASYQTVTNVPYAEMERLFGGARRSQPVR